MLISPFFVRYFKLTHTHQYKSKVGAAALHFLCGLAIFFVVSIVVFKIWFPYPFSKVSGGTRLFWWVTSVDLCCGPMLTFIVFNTIKSRREIFFDIGIVIAVQLAALSYGVYSLAVARPVYVVFEVDRFRVLSTADIQMNEISLANPEFQRFSWFGPTFIGVRIPRPGEENRIRSIEFAMQGLDISSRPKYWVSYGQVSQDILSRAKPIDTLSLKSQENISILGEAARRANLAPDKLKYLPMQSWLVSDWVALVNPDDANIIGYLEIDGF